MLKFFAEKMWVAFAVQKLLTFFSAKNIRILYIESAKTVNEMTLNELVKLTTLCTTGPRISLWYKWLFEISEVEITRVDCIIYTEKRILFGNKERAKEMKRRKDSGFSWVCSGAILIYATSGAILIYATSGAILIYATLHISSWLELYRNLFSD